ncbi:MAG TPA: YkvA family protein [Burkholderiales bacterium]|nr:YkvA family protein [Burkholderiales bacterium]
MNQLRNGLARLKSEVVAVWFCARHPRTPFTAKALAIAVAAYAFSPIDLIPDFIPVLGYLDDVVLLPVGIWIVLELVPEDVIAECREKAAHWLAERRPGPRSYFGAAVILALWLAALGLAWRWVEDWLAG